MNLILVLVLTVTASTARILHTLQDLAWSNHHLKDYHVEGLYSSNKLSSAAGTKTANEATQNLDRIKLHENEPNQNLFIGAIVRTKRNAFEKCKEYYMDRLVLELLKSRKNIKTIGELAQLLEKKTPNTPPFISTREACTEFVRNLPTDFTLTQAENYLNETVENHPCHKEGYDNPYDLAIEMLNTADDIITAYKLYKCIKDWPRNPPSTPKPKPPKSTPSTTPCPCQDDILKFLSRPRIHANMLMPNFFG